MGYEAKKTEHAGPKHGNGATRLPLPSYRYATGAFSALATIRFSPS